MRLSRRGKGHRREGSQEGGPQEGGREGHSAVQPEPSPIETIPYMWHPAHPQGERVLRPSLQSRQGCSLSLFSYSLRASSALLTTDLKSLVSRSYRMLRVRDLSLSALCANKERGGGLKQGRWGMEANQHL